jgi:hypothetical protein
MNRNQAIAKATHLRKGDAVFVKSTGALEKFQSISAAKRFSRSVGLTAVSLSDKERLPTEL